MLQSPPSLFHQSRFLLPLPRPTPAVTPHFLSKRVGRKSLATKRRRRHSIRPSEEPEVLGPEEDDADSRHEVWDQIFGGEWVDIEDKDIDEMEPKQRMTRIIVELVNAGGYFEEKLETYKQYLDEELLKTFFKRIEFSEKFEEKENVEGLKMIWRRVRAEVERLKATPAIRLLDELLKILHPSFGSSQENRCRQALALMYTSFNEPKKADVDIFELAESLADGEEPPEQLLQEHVDKRDFETEVKGILEDAQKQQQQLTEKRDQMIKKMQQQPQQDGLTNLLVEKQLDALEDYLRVQKRNIKDVRILLEMAQSI